MNNPANSHGTPFRSTNMEANQPVSSTQMGSNALRSDQHYGVGFQPCVPSYGYRPLHSTGPWGQADDHISTRAPTFPASRLGVDERGSPQPVTDQIRKSDSNCRYQSLPPPPPLRFMGTDTNSRANHTVQRFSGTVGGNDEPALMYRASEGSRQVPTTLPGGTVHSSDFRAPVPRPSDQVAVAPRPVESIDMEAELHDLRRKLASFDMLAVELSGSGVPPPAPGTTLKYSPEGAKLAKKSKSTNKHSGHPKSRLKSHKQLKYVSNKEGSDRSASSSSEEESPDRDSDDSCESRHGSDLVRMVHSRRSPKLPPFTGLGESWNVCLNRFNDVARSRGWTAAEKLDELLPRLQGQAGEFVYGQLSTRTRESFKGLSKELECRFRKIETAGTFRKKFSQRRQKVGESIESYAAELKRLYDKAYPDRDRRTRKEDLLRRFMEGLVDDDARHSVEFVRAPDDIDEAVFEVVNFMDSRRRSSTTEGRRHRQGRVTRVVHDHSDDSDEEYSDDERYMPAVRALGRPPRVDKKANEGKATTMVEAGDPAPTVPTPPVDQHDEMKCLEQKFDQLIKSMKQDAKQASQQNNKMLKAITELTVPAGQDQVGKATPYRKMNNARDVQQGNPTGTQPQNNSYRRAAPRQWNEPGGTGCLRCGKDGHFARDCWTFMGQVQMSSQSGRPSQGAATSSHPNL